MSNASKDENRISTLIATLNTDGSSIVTVKVNPLNHALKNDDNTTGSDNGNNNDIANRDDNHVPVFIAISSVDGVTPVEIYADSSGALLINSN